MKLLRILPLVVGSAAAGILAIASPAHALTWNLQNVQFSDGGTATGSFDYDSINNAINATSIVISSPSYGSINFTSGFTNVVTSTSIRLVNDSTTFGLGLNFSSALSNTSPPNTTISLLDTSGYGIFSFSQFNLSSGNVTNGTPVPFDIPGGATIPTVGSLLALAAMRKLKKSIASKTSIASPVWETVK